MELSDEIKLFNSFDCQTDVHRTFKNTVFFPREASSCEILCNNIK